MDKKMIEDHLALARRHILEGDVNINRQRRIVRDLERDGHATIAAQAKKLLEQFIELQTMHIADRDRLQAELNALGQNEATPGPA